MSDWLSRLRAGDRPTLGRVITAVENETIEAKQVMKAIYPHLGKALVVGFTGPPGAGKSTLINAYIGELRARGQTVGVVAVDPSSPMTGGAILGDRIRMGEHANDGGVFVRSLASRGHLGGLSRTAAHVIDVMDASGRDVVIVETVGAGQSEVEVAGIAGTKVVVAAPGLGDDIQAIKAGILEIADVFVVNKGDLPLAERTAAQLSEMLRLVALSDWRVPVLRTVATNKEGIAEMADAIAAHNELAGKRRPAPEARALSLIASAAAERAKKRIAALKESESSGLCRAVLLGEMDIEAAAEKALSLIAGEEVGT
jgi:LAO/AO transport system kinase